jgi:LPS-assembly lipoprotein
MCGAVIRQGDMRMMKRNLLVIGLAGLLSACGFQLRGTGDVQFALKELDVKCWRTTTFASTPAPPTSW